MLSDHQRSKLVLDFLSDNNNLQKIPVFRQNSANSLAKLQSMNKRLNKTFGAWKEDALVMIKNKEDQIFLE